MGKQTGEIDFSKKSSEILDKIHNEIRNLSADEINNLVVGIDKNFGYATDKFGNVIYDYSSGLNTYKNLLKIAGEMFSYTGKNGEFTLARYMFDNEELDCDSNVGQYLKLQLLIYSATESRVNN